MSVYDPKSDSSRGEYILLDDFNNLAKTTQHEDEIGISKDIGQHSLPDVQPDVKDDEETQTGETLALIGFFALFKYSSSWEKFVIAIATAASVFSGLEMPVFLMVYGKTIDALIEFSIQTSAENCTVNYTVNCSELTQDFLDDSAMKCMWMALIGVISMVSSYVMVFLFSVVAANQAFKIRCKFLASALKQDVGWYDTNRTGDFSQRITGDMEKVQEGIGEKVGLCVKCITATTCSISLALYFGWKIALVMLALTPITTLVMAILAKKQVAVAREEIEAYSSAGAIAEEVLSAIRTVVAFGGERKEIERYGHSLAPGRKKGIKRGLFVALGTALSYSSIFLYSAIGFWYGVYLFLEERGEENPQYTGGIIMIIFCNILHASNVFSETALYFEAFAIARGAASKIFQIIDRDSLIDSGSDSGAKPSSVIGAISFKDAHFSYPARSNVPVLTGVTFNVEPGETVALVGPSGCGKSTIIQLILRFYDTDSGIVALDGNNVADLNVGWLRTNIGLVGQEPVLFSTTIEENIIHGKAGASQEEVKNAAKLANAHDFIESLPLKYKTVVGEHGAQLSGGQKQRIAIARAIIKDPKILLLDEATSALDTESETLVQAALEKASLGRTTVVVAHRLTTVRNADKILVLSGGTVREVGKHNDLMEKRGIYYRFVLSQITEADKVRFADCDNDFEEKRAKELPFNLKNTDCDLYEGTHEKITLTGITDEDDFNSLDEEASFLQQQPLKSDLCTFDVRSGNGLNQKSVSIAVEMEDEKKPNPSLIRLLKLCLQDWPYVTVGAISAILTGFYSVACGVLYGEIFALFKEERHVIEEKYILVCVMFLLMGVTCFVFNFLQVHMFSIAGGKLTCRLRKMIYANILSQGMVFFDHQMNSVGALCSRLTSDASDVQGATGSRIALLVQCGSTVTAAIVLSFWYGYKIALVVLPFIPLNMMAFYFNSRVSSGGTDSERKAREESSKIAVEATTNIRTVASLHLENTIYSYFRSVLNVSHKKSRVQSFFKAVMFCFSYAVPSYFFAAALYYGTRLVVNGELQYGDLIKIIEGVIVCVMVSGHSVAFTPEYQRGKLAAVRIFKLLDLKPKIDTFAEGGHIMKDIKGDIRFLKVHFSYPSRPDVKILKNLSLEIESGKTVALVGSSGCGKSTCIQLIERLYDVNSGKVVLDGVNVKEINVTNLRSHLGLVSQEPVVFSCSIADNIAYGDNTRKADHAEVISAARQANIHSFITSLPQGYDTPVGHKGTHLSGGQKQRVAIARALLRNPKILLLDEATSALDAESEQVVQEALDAARKGRTCLVIAHRLSTIQNADTIIVIHNGKVAEQGTHEELLGKKGYYYNLQNIREK